MPVYEETNPNKITKDGRKYYFMCCYKNKYGEKKRYKSKKYKGKRECEKAERDFLTNAEKKDITDYNITFEDVYNEWLEYYKKQVKSTSYYSTTKRANKHIYTFFKDYKLHSIKTNILYMWLDKIDKEDLTDDYKNVLIGIVQKILKYAVENYDFDPKVAYKLQKKKVEIPTNIKKDTDENFWTLDEFNIFIKEVDNDFYKLLFTFLFYTGLRIGEVIALTWNNVNLKKKTISITQTFTNNVYDKSRTLITPKTKNSVRTVELDNNTSSLLKKHYKEEQKYEGFEDNWFVFGGLRHTGEMSIRRNLSNYIDKVKETDNKFKKITVHGFRHSHATLLYNIGCDFQQIADRLGDTIDVVQDTYVHIYRSKQTATVNALNKLNAQ